jgi:translation initiation factor IF-2
VRSRRSCSSTVTPSLAGARAHHQLRPAQRAAGHHRGAQVRGDVAHRGPGEALQVPVRLQGGDPGRALEGQPRPLQPALGRDPVQGPRGGGGEGEGPRRPGPRQDPQLRDPEVHPRRLEDRGAEERGEPRRERHAGRAQPPLEVHLRRVALQADLRRHGRQGHRRPPPGAGGRRSSAGQPAPRGGGVGRGPRGRRAPGPPGPRGRSGGPRPAAGPGAAGWPAHRRRPRWRWRSGSGAPRPGRRWR